MEALKDAINRAQDISLIAHIQPDGDTLGSCFALAHIINKMGKKAIVYCDSEMPKRYAALFSPYSLVPPKNAEKAADLAIAVDCADKVRLGKCLKLFENAKATLNIDHHMTNEGYADINYITDASSVGEIIFELLRLMNIKPDKQSAKFLYIAMSTDTGNYTYSNTNKNVLLYTAELIELFDLRETADVLFRQRSLVSTKLIGRALSRLELYADERIASLTLLESDMKEFNAQSGDCENIVDFAREIEHTKVAVFFRELPSGVKISFRSKDEVDVGAVAAMYGGGGHTAASGCVASGKLDEVKTQVIEKLLELL